MHTCWESNKRVTCGILVKRLIYVENEKELTFREWVVGKIEVTENQ